MGILVSYLLTAQPLTEYLREQVWILLCGDGGHSLKHRMGARSALKKGAMILPDREQEDDEVVEADLEGGGISACVDGSSSSGGSSGGSSTSGSGVGTALGHLLLTVGLLGFAFLVANAVPFFSDFQNIIGSALGAPILFGWPPLLYLAAERKNGDPGSMLYSRGDPNLERVPLATKLICWLSLYVMLPMCFVLGLVSAIQTLIVDWETFGKPFD